MFDAEYNLALGESIFIIHPPPPPPCVVKHGVGGKLFGNNSLQGYDKGGGYTYIHHKERSTRVEGRGFFVTIADIIGYMETQFPFCHGTI